MNSILNTIFVFFLINVRLRSIQDFIQYLREWHDEDKVKLLYKYRNLSRNKCKCELDLEFLSKCKTYYVFPKFLRFKLYKRCLQTSSLYKSWQSKLLINEIDCKKKSIRKCSRELVELESLLCSSFYKVEVWAIRHFVSESVNIFRRDVMRTHVSKLRSLGIDNNLAPCNPDKVIFNYSSLVLNDRVKLLLAFGLDFGLPIYKLNFYKYFLCFEKLVNNVRNNNCTNYSEFVSRIRELSMRYFYNFKPYKIFSAIINRDDISKLRRLSENEDVVISRPDKGKAVVIVNKTDYLTSMSCLLYTSPSPRDKRQSRMPSSA